MIIRRFVARNNATLHQFYMRKTLQCKTTTHLREGCTKSSSLRHWRHFHQQQYRCFAETSTKNAAPDIQEDEYELSPSIVSASNDDDNDDDDETRSLHSSIHYILKKIPIGHLDNNHLAQARSMIYIVSKWHNENGAKLCESLLERLYKEQYVGHNDSVVIDTEMYNICMDAWNKSGVDGEKIVDRVTSIMRRMEERYIHESYNEENEDMVIRPDRISYNCVINAYSKWEDNDSSNKVEEVLKKMNTLAKHELNSDYALLLQPDTFTYNSLMNYYATRNNSESAQRAEDLLLQMSELSKQGDNDIQMNTTSFNTVLKAWRNSETGIDGAQRAESILRMMMKLYSHGHENVRPDTKSYSTVFSSYSKVNPEDASTAVENVMNILDELEGSFWSSDTNINSCYNAAANVIVKSGVDDAVKRVQELVTRMKNMDAVPDKFIISSLMEAYGKEGSYESFKQGKELLMEMVMDKSLDPETVPFNILLKSILKGNSVNKLKQVDELITAMDQIGGNARPDLASYNMVISELSRSSDNDAQQKAVEYMKNMLKSYREGYEKAKPDSFVFNCIISMLARNNEAWADDVIYRTLMAMESQQKRGNASIIIDTITYNQVIGKLAQSHTKENAKKVMSLLKHMEDNSTSSNKAITPDIITYTSVLILQGKVNPQRAADISYSYLERAIASNEKVQIDRFGFQQLLKALSRSNKLQHAMMARKAWEWIENSDKANILDSDLCNLVLLSYNKANNAKTAEKALSFLTERISRYKDGDSTTILPTMVGFGSILSSLGNANRVDDALRLVEIMKVLSKDGVPSVEPDEGCYATILHALAHSEADSAAPQALRVVKRMKEGFGTIPTTALNAAIHVCSRTSPRRAKNKSIEAAFDLFQLGKECDCRDAVTYGLMIRTCINQTDDDATRFKLVQVS